MKRTDYNSKGGMRSLRKSLYDIAHMVKIIPYSGVLPSELKEYHYYITDYGHSIMSITKKHFDQLLQQDFDKEDLYQYEIPIPVKYVLAKGYQIIDGFVIVDAEYDDDFGLVVDEDYEEF